VEATFTVYRDPSYRRRREWTEIQDLIEASEGDRIEFIVAGFDLMVMT
jgi:hypothetical protein